MTWISDTILASYLDEALPVEQMIEIEARLREEPGLRDRLAGIIEGQDYPLHQLGAIWRRHRLSCPDREEWSQFLLGVLPQEAVDYFRFHLEEMRCGYCAANLDDLRSAQQATQELDQAVQQRRRRIFETSAGRVNRDRESPKL